MTPIYFKINLICSSRFRPINGKIYTLKIRMINEILTGVNLSIYAQVFRPLQDSMQLYKHETNKK